MRVNTTRSHSTFCWFNTSMPCWCACSPFQGWNLSLTFVFPLLFMMVSTAYFTNLFLNMKLPNTKYPVFLFRAFNCFPKIIDYLKFFKYRFIYFNWRLITLQYCIGFAIHQHVSTTGIHVFSILNPPPSLYHPSGSSQCTSPKHPVSFIEPGLVIRFTYDITHVSMPFSQIIPPSPSPTESKRLFYTSMSLSMSHIQGYRYHLSKFHIYVLVNCIGILLSGLLHSV